MKCGNTLLLYDDDDPDAIPHLHIAITDADENGYVVLVSVTTLRARSDTMTVLDANCHPFIGKPSVITYAYSKLLTSEQIARLIEDGDASRKANASEDIVKRAQDGMLETDRSPIEVQEFFVDWWRKNRNSN